jgi:hypothetical protein
MADETKRTVIETGTEIEGAIKSERAIVLSGNVKGQVTAPSLEVTQEGAVKGTIKVNRFSCKGEVGGEVMAEAVELSGRVLDATVIRSKTLDVKLAQGDGGVEVSFGNCELHVGDLPAKPAAKPASSASESSKMVAKAQAVSDDVVDVVSDLMK